MINATTLYHLSPRKNRESILRLGLDPALFSRGYRKTLWVVSKEKIAWATAHLCRLYNLQPEEFDVWYIPPRAARRLSKNPLKGVFETPCRLVPNQYMEWLRFALYQGDETLRALRTRTP